MNSAISDTLLKDFNLRSTPNRQEILHLFLRKNYALSHGDIEKEIDNSLDRVTVYRTLKTFLDKGLIHKVLDDEGALKYALCNEACTTAGHHHDLCISNAPNAAKRIVLTLRFRSSNCQRDTVPAR